jgi:hypothetical protein
MGVSGQHHAPAALYPRGKGSRYPLYRRLGGPQSRSGHRGYRKNPLSLPGIEPRSPGCPARSQTLYCLSYPGSIRHEQWRAKLGTFLLLPVFVSLYSFPSLFLLTLSWSLFLPSVLTCRYTSAMFSLLFHFHFLPRSGK